MAKIENICAFIFGFSRYLAIEEEDAAYGRERGGLWSYWRKQRLEDGGCERFKVAGYFAFGFSIPSNRRSEVVHDQLVIC